MYRIHCNALVCLRIHSKSEKFVCFIFVMIECDLLNASENRKTNEGRKKKQRRQNQQTELIFECYDVMCAQRSNVFETRENFVDFIAVFNSYK